MYWWTDYIMLKQPTRHNHKQMKWFVYIIRCSYNSLYTGITTDIKRRFKEHNEQGTKIAKYLRGRGPLSLVYSIEAESKNDALHLEHEIKNMSKKEKEALISTKV